MKTNKKYSMAKQWLNDLSATTADYFNPLKYMHSSNVDWIGQEDAKIREVVYGKQKKDL